MSGFAFVPYSAFGHVNPMLPVAAELAATGARVRMLAGPRFAPRITGAGAEHVPLDRDAEVWSPPSWGPRQLARLAEVRWQRKRALRAVARRCRGEFEADRPDLVIVDPAVPATARVAEQLGIPVAWLSTTHARSPRLRGTVLVNSLPELQPERPRYGPRYRFVGPLLGPRGGTGRRTSGPLLLVSPGTVFARTAKFFRGVVEEFTGTGWTVVMATGHVDPAELGPLPHNVVAHRWVPQRELLAEAAVFLTHGGMNSVQEALAEAVPMLLAPRNAEQRATAQCLVQLGLGDRLSGSVRRQVEALAEDGRTRAALGEMQARLRQRDGVGQAVGALLGAVGQ
ncbi:hypothetical protein LZ318_34275 [Saccharopolyspora indica]|uniref:nucleotide disphospho-sugar-binding domain-containing protein n=1 Tax=Saccharopolyspora indica TaxID=1229659 RepID=UPI0022EB8F7A|nr:nucleotide disphospho-sugar-binding domain-containing protein [Saccharopolyspora indica]MDA3647535.1 hypothetical protein [Saccharopolyspora indica]